MSRSRKVDAQRLLCAIRAEGTEEWLARMQGFGIDTSCAVGVSVTRLRELRKGYVRDNTVAFELWDSGVHEGRLLATTFFKPGELGEEDVERLVKALNSWDVCDMACNEVFRKLSFAFELPWRWVKREEEFVKRAGFALVATLALRRHEGFDYSSFFDEICRGASDERKMVHKSVNWALRQIGKSFPDLWSKSVDCAQELSGSAQRYERWVGSNALRQLRMPKWRPDRA